MDEFAIDVPPDQGSSYQAPAPLGVDRVACSASVIAQICLPEKTLYAIAYYMSESSAIPRIKTNPISIAQSTPSISGTGVPSNNKLIGMLNTTDPIVASADVTLVAVPAICPIGSKAIAVRFPKVIDV